MTFKERKSQASRIERQILKDLLSILTLKMSVDSKAKLSRTEALAKIMKKHYQSDDAVLSQIERIDQKRNLKPRLIRNANIRHH